MPEKSYIICHYVYFLLGAMQPFKKRNLLKELKKRLFFIIYLLTGFSNISIYQLQWVVVYTQNVVYFLVVLWFVRAKALDQRLYR